MEDQGVLGQGIAGFLHRLLNALRSFSDQGVYGGLVHKGKGNLYRNAARKPPQEAVALHQKAALPTHLPGSLRAARHVGGDTVRGNTGGALPGAVIGKGDGGARQTGAQPLAELLSRLRPGKPAQLHLSRGGIGHNAPGGLNVKAEPQIGKYNQDNAADDRKQGGFFPRTGCNAFALTVFCHVISQLQRTPGSPVCSTNGSKI
ncbi:hypothetical protein SDC9_144491 [bioreactor metagenome]|uniref:Uncharacterized protein n=1 Tax=bioreactor metagenome TaxID=1076179 RepID=A0A645E7W0_9ZZZZ